ncbi:MAG TPA: GrpB family protein [Chryseolinea sp.]
MKKTMRHITNICFKFVAMEKIILEKHDPRWIKIFETEREILLGALSGVVVHHVGSTAVKDLAAKPIIDICIEASRFPPLEDQLKTLRDLGYENRGEAGVPGRIWFVKGQPRKFNLHYCAVGSPVAERQLAFRDALRKSEKLRREYEALKIANALNQDIDSAEYAGSKTGLIESVIAGS